MAGYPRLSIDLDVVAENTLLLAARLLGDGFTLAGVTKCVDGEPRVGQAMLEAGCAGLGDSRLPSLARLAAASLGPLTLIRAPQPDELATAARVAHRILLSDPGAARTLGEDVYISSDGCGVFYRDPATGEVRSSRKEDLENCAKVVQALDNVSATSAVVSAQDCPIETRVLHEFDACVRSNEKHNIVVSIKEDWEARGLLKMAEALAGSKEELKRRPMFTAIICTVSPLHQERFGMDLALVLAEAGIPVSFYPMPILGATGPVTIAGSAVVNNAEFLSGATLVQLAHPGAKVIHGGGPTAMYMNSGAYASNSPEALLLRSCQGHLADFYGVPAWYGAGATTAKEPGIQSAYENTLAMFMAYANGADVAFGTGLLDGSRILCLENMVVDNEIIGMVKRILTGIEVSEETLAVELIKKMGFNGNYLFDNHTRKHVRELWQAKLGETGSYDGWKNAGAKSTTEKAQEKVAEILAAEPAPFPADLGAEFDAIIAAAAREAAAQ